MQCLTFNLLNGQLHYTQRLQRLQYCLVIANVLLGWTAVNQWRVLANSCSLLHSTVFFFLPALPHGFLPHDDGAQPRKQPRKHTRVTVCDRLQPTTTMTAKFEVFVPSLQVFPQVCTFLHTPVALVYFSKDSISFRILEGTFPCKVLFVTAHRFSHLT
jgi:hypothetical protein